MRGKTLNVIEEYLCIGSQEAAEFVDNLDCQQNG